MSLATIEKITNIQPIDGALRIDSATVLDWNVVIRKGDFEIGDLCIYIQIDTIIDLSKEWFSHLKKTRINMATIFGARSDGLIIKIPDEILNSVLLLDEGLDVANIIGVYKYEKDEHKMKILENIKKESPFLPFPFEIISRTDETNLRNKKKCLQELIGKEFYISRKMDGSSMTIVSKNRSITICSRNIILWSNDEDYINQSEKFLPNSDMVKFVINNHIHDAILDLNIDIVIQGEFCGYNVNSNRIKYQKGVFEFYIFNVKIDNCFCGLDKLNDIQKQLSNIIKIVPVTLVETFDQDIHDIDWFQSIANNEEYKDGIKAEGIIIRPVEPFYSSTLNKYFSVKILNQKY